MSGASTVAAAEPASSPPAPTAAEAAAAGAGAAASVHREASLRSVDSMKTVAPAASYDMHYALFSGAFRYAWEGHVFTWDILLYELLLIAIAIVVGCFACPQSSPLQTWSVALGSSGCWRNSYTTAYSDLTLLTLTSFLLSVLANNVIGKWWSTRVMLQDAINNSADIMTRVCVSMSRATPDARRDVGLASLKRRLRLAFRIMLISARTNVVLSAEEAHGIFSELEAPGASGAPPLMTRGEADALHEHRHAYVVLAWALRDVQLLVEEGHVPACMYAALWSDIGNLRALYHNIPFHVRVQLPYAAVSIIACVVHLTLLQLTFICASLIGAGIATPGLEYKAMSGIISVTFVPLAFLGLLKLQALLSNPFGKYAAQVRRGGGCSGCQSRGLPPPPPPPLSSLSHSLVLSLSSPDKFSRPPA